MSSSSSSSSAFDGCRLHLSPDAVIKWVNCPAHVVQCSPELAVQSGVGLPRLVTQLVKEWTLCQQKNRWKRGKSRGKKKDWSPRPYQSVVDTFDFFVSCLSSFPSFLSVPLLTKSKTRDVPFSPFPGPSTALLLQVKLFHSNEDALAPSGNKGHTLRTHAQGPMS